MFSELVRFFKREGDFSFWKNIFIIATIAGIANAGLLAIINFAANIYQDEIMNYQYLAIYIVVFLIFFLAKKHSILESSKEVERVIRDVRERISNKIKNSELLTIENMDTSKIFTRLTRDTSLISQSASEILSTAQSLIMVFFALIYIFILSAPMFFIIIIALSVTIAIYTVFSQEVQKDLNKNSQIEDQFYNSLDSALSGFKELKMNSKKRDDLYAHQNDVLNKLYNLKIDLSEKFITVIMFTETFLYILLGVIVFVVPHIIIEDNTTVIQITASLLFIIGPIDNAIYIFPLASKTRRSIKNIHKLEDLIDKNMINSSHEMAENFNDFKTIELKNMEFEYINSEDERLFAIEPVNMTINRGELVFIIGGNGSGKSTFIKTLLNLYYPTGGEIVIDDSSIDEYNSSSYRDLFSIILNDFYLSKEIYGIDNINYRLINKLLKEMGLDNKTKFIDGAFTNIALSTGQKKRLALIVSILEDKQIYVFDEWAADQDPEFRKYFYETILKRLQEQGKTVIAVTHDDKYFSFADKIYKMQDGRMNSIASQINWNQKL